MEKIDILISKKIKEHQYEIDGAQKDLLDLKLKTKDANMAVKQLVLKDKILFHKSALLVLEDLKKELKDV